MRIFVLCLVITLQALVHYKWRAFARRLLIGQLLCYLAWLGSFMGFMLLFNHEDALKPNPQIVKTWHVSAFHSLGWCWPAQSIMHALPAGTKQPSRMQSLDLYMADDTHPAPAAAARPGQPSTLCGRRHNRKSYLVRYHLIIIQPLRHVDCCCASSY